MSTVSSKCSSCIPIRGAFAGTAPPHSILLEIRLGGHDGGPEVPCTCASNTIKAKRVDDTPAQSPDAEYYDFFEVLLPE